MNSNYDLHFCSDLDSDIQSFRRMVYRYYNTHARTHLPWRINYDPYHIFISEVMLQQTQVDRVMVKFVEFIEHFSDVKTLAYAPLEDVLAYWKGLGYNRRAISLRNAARIIIESYNGKLPNEPSHLITLPGIGKATAASITAFAFNQPVVFLETNIKTVLIYHFLRNKQRIHDTDLFPIAEKVLDRKNPRTWYAALMDYGTMLKKEVGNLSKRSASYRKQTAFKGSKREIRGNILKHLLADKSLTCVSLSKRLKQNPDTLSILLDNLVAEGMIQCKRGIYSIGK